MFKREEYIRYIDIASKVSVLEMNNRMINEDLLKKISLIKDERVKEFISTNNIEGDEVSFSVAKKFLRNEQLNDTQLEKRWMGIKYADDVIKSDRYMFNLEGIHEVHRALVRDVETPGGIWKSKLNRVGTLITAHPEDVPQKMFDLMTTYSTSKMTEGPSVFNIIPLISEFLAIHPYEDGNGRMSRLIMNQELYDGGYKFARYISISKFLWDDRKRYIGALESRNRAWEAGTLTPADLLPLFDVILDALIAAAKIALKYQYMKKMTREQFRAFAITEFAIPKSISEIIESLNISNSRSSVAKWLKEMVDENLIQLSGQGKGSKYVKLNGNYNV